jgi:hypothetical protein
LDLTCEISAADMADPTVPCRTFVALPACSAAAAARELRRVVGADPHSRIAHTDADVYEITCRFRPRWASVVGWATVPVGVGVCVLAVRRTVTCVVVIDIEDGRTVLRLSGAVRPSLLTALENLGAQAPVVGPRPQPRARRTPTTDLLAALDRPPSRPVPSVADYWNPVPQREGER